MRRHALLVADVHFNSQLSCTLKEYMNCWYCTTKLAWTPDGTLDQLTDNMPSPFCVAFLEMNLNKGKRQQVAPPLSFKAGQKKCRTWDTTSAVYVFSVTCPVFLALLWSQVMNLLEFSTPKGTTLSMLVLNPSTFTVYLRCTLSSGSAPTTSTRWPPFGLHLHR